MPTIVLHKTTNRKYLLLGTGYGAYKSSTPGIIGGDWFPNEEQDEIPAAAVCDADGNIQWLLTDELRVLEIDGVPVERFRDALAATRDDGPPGAAAAESTIPVMEECPACAAVVTSDLRECPSCGLALIIEEES